MKKSIYVGNGFLESQLLFVIPFVAGYAKEKGINRIIFEESLSSKLRGIREIADILRLFIVVEIDRKYSRKYRIKNLITKFLIAGSVLLPSFRLAHASSRNGLLENVCWYDSQLRHAVWDHALQQVKDGSLQLSFGGRLRAAASVYLAVKKARHLVKTEGVCAAVLGHTVYAGRGLIAELRKNNVDCVAHAANVFHRLHLNRDTAWSLMSAAEWTAAMSIVKNQDFERFWQKRKRGESSNIESVNASRGSRIVSTSTPKNVIFLHVFRDSPFNYIDRDRIFADYVQWVEQTLKFIASSDESWLIKSHPSSARWGENQEVWLTSIGNKVFGNHWPDHISIDYSEYSNINLLKHINRFVTYSGTVHLEAACFGIKPIVISNVSLASFDTSLVLKPKDLNEYKSFLMEDSGISKFELPPTAQLIAIRLLYIREELLKFQREIGSSPIFRGDTKAAFEIEFNSVSAHVKESVPAFLRAGSLIAAGLPRTVSLRYLETWNAAYQNESRMFSKNIVLNPQDSFFPGAYFETD